MRKDETNHAETGLSMEQRLALFYEEVKHLPPFATFNEAYDALTRVLNAVEDRHSGRP